MPPFLFMGTNYYRKPILTKERKNKLHQLIDEEKFESDWEHENDPEDSILNMIHWLTEGVHICKRSCGWYINFDHNWGKYYQPNRKSLEEFLSEPGYYIENEYGESILSEDFWKMVDEWNSSSKINGEPLWDAKAYDEWEHQRNPNWKSYSCMEDRNKVYQKFGIFCDSDDFKVDGLRFAVFSDFS